MSISPLSAPQAMSVRPSNVIPFKGVFTDPASVNYLDIARSLDSFEKEMGLAKPNRGSLATNVIGINVDNAKMLVQDKIDMLRDKVYQLVYKDPMLKDVDNKRAYHRDRVKMCLDACKPGDQKPLGYIAFDIDNFGGYNNEFGHAEGDNALFAFADTVQTVLGNKGTLYRIGGEEFAALLPGLTSEQVKEVAEEVRIAVEVNTQMMTDSSELPGPFTVSLGYASIEPLKELENIQELYEKSKVCKEAKKEFREKFGEHFEPLEHGADAALYISKLYKGRNSGTDVAELQDSKIYDLVLTLGRGIASVMRNSSQKLTEQLVPQLELFANETGGTQAKGKLAKELTTLVDGNTEEVKKELLKTIDFRVASN